MHQHTQYRGLPSQRLYLEKRRFEMLRFLENFGATQLLDIYMHFFFKKYRGVGH